VRHIARSFHGTGLHIVRGTRPGVWPDGRPLDPTAVPPAAPVRGQRLDLRSAR
jgi:hypothetical protein